MLQLPFSQLAGVKGVRAEDLARDLGLPPTADLSRPAGQLLKENQIAPQALQAAVQKANPLAAEAAEKNWQKIRLKFALWAVAFALGMLLLSRGRLSLRVRMVCLAASALVFGVWLGVEPNAPGTLKDALVLYGEKGVIFPPRLIAFAGFLLMSIVGNKVFCGWGCQFGTLQDLLSHLPARKLKPPFWLSNAVRAVVLAAIAGCALLVPVDILEPVDPFRVFRLGAAGAVVMAAAVLVAGIWVYRPWCTFACPFGLVSWLAERISLARVRVNLETCVNCRACERACPTHSMEGIRGQRAFAQDCFACGACLRVCPVSALRWGLRPPVGTPPSGDGPQS
jgi:NAD-dependent dihydropyrimidine dehydrogenase PreA subunit